jgi:hypothetical protein
MSHLRCPACEAPNPKAAPRGVSAGERLVGVILLVVGIALAIPIFFLLLFVPTWGGARGRAGLAALAIIPVGSIFHGVLFVSGIHPREFYAWWNSLAPVSRFLIIGALVLLAVGLVLVVWLSSAGVGGHEVAPDGVPDFPDED